SEDQFLDIPGAQIPIAVFRHGRAVLLLELFRKRLQPRVSLLLAYTFSQDSDNPVLPVCSVGVRPIELQRNPNLAAPQTEARWHYSNNGVRIGIEPNNLPANIAVAGK